MKKQFRLIAEMAVAILVIATMVACATETGSNDPTGKGIVTAECRWGTFYPDEDNDGLADSFDGQQICVESGDSLSSLVLNVEAGNTVDPCLDDPINDDDGDGVCESVDKCPGFDDSQDADHDNIPDGCDSCTITTYSMDEYDGHINNSKINFGLGGNVITSLYTNYSVDRYHHYGFVTFDLRDLTSDQPIQNAQFGIFKFDSSNPFHRYYTSSSKIREWEVSTQEYDYWQTCTYTGCDSPTPLDQLPLSDEIFTMSKNAGYWVVDSDQFVNLLNNRSGSLVTFIVYEESFDNSENKTYNSSSWEDGGNHGGTGNLPYLQLSYDICPVELENDKDYVFWQQFLYQQEYYMIYEDQQPDDVFEVLYSDTMALKLDINNPPPWSMWNYPYFIAPTTDFKEISWDTISEVEFGISLSVNFGCRPLTTCDNFGNNCWKAPVEPEIKLVIDTVKHDEVDQAMGCVCQDNICEPIGCHPIEFENNYGSYLLTNSGGGFFYTNDVRVLNVFESVEAQDALAWSFHLSISCSSAPFTNTLTVRDQPYLIFE